MVVYQLQPDFSPVYCTNIRRTKSKGCSENLSQITHMNMTSSWTWNQRSQNNKRKSLLHVHGIDAILLTQNIYMQMQCKLKVARKSQ